MRRRSDWTLLALVTLVVFVALATLTWSRFGLSWNYLLGVLIIMAIYALAALGLSLEFGYTGLLNFGHVAFMAVGGYGTALLYERLDRAGFAGRLEGTSASGAAALLPLALLLGVGVGVASLALLERTRRTAKDPRWASRWAALAGTATLVACYASWWPLGADGARTVLVLLCVLASVAVAGAGGILLGLPTVRLREDYLAIVTLGAAEILKSVAVNEEWLTHGTLGIQQLYRPAAAWATDSTAWNAFADALGVRPIALAHAVLALVLVAVAYAALERLVRSPWGRVLKAIREDEEVASALGKNVTWYKLQSLMIGSAVAAVAGVLLAWHLASVYPDHFPLIVTFYIFIIVVVGGIGNHRGALAGAVILWGAFELARNVTLLERIGFESLAGPPQAVAVGLVLILFVMFRPQGLVGRKEELLHAK